MIMSFRAALVYGGCFMVTPDLFWYVRLLGGWRRSVAFSCLWQKASWLQFLRFAYPAQHRDALVQCVVRHVPRGAASSVRYEHGATMRLG